MFCEFGGEYCVRVGRVVDPLWVPMVTSLIPRRVIFKTEKLNPATSEGYDLR